MFVDLKRVYYIFSILSYILTMLLGIAYIYTNSLSILLFVLLGILISSVLYTFNNIKYYILHLVFYLTIFIFLVSRPTIDYFKTGLFNTYQPDAYKFSFIIVAVSVIGLTVGGLIIPKKGNFNATVSYKSNHNNLRIVSLVIFIFSYPFYILRLLERLFFRMNTTYYDYYANFKSELPYITYIISTFMIYSLCIYLATKPSKLASTVTLGMVIMANTIYLFIGTRNPFILSLLFSFIYYFMRNQGERGKWIGFKEKIILYLGTPVLMVVMGILNYIRDDSKVTKTGLFDILLDFIYKQGTSFGVLARGYLYNSNIPVRETVNFTFGPIIEYFTKGSLGILFGSKAFEHTTNSVELALNSNSYAHNLSYIVMKSEYLDGHGLGSSYIMEIFTDYGMLGVFFFSTILGSIFTVMMRIAYGKNILLFGITLLVLNNLFFMPRSSFSESFFSLFTMQFWSIILVIYLLSKLINKKTEYVIKKEGE